MSTGTIVVVSQIYLDRIARVRQAMADQGKSAIVITPTRWSPLSKGGFPPELFEGD